MNERVPIGWVRQGRDTRPLRVLASDLTGGPHALVTGRSGSGKSMLVLGLILWIYLHRSDVHQVYVDAKGVDSEQLLSWLPGLALRHPDRVTPDSVGVFMPWSSYGLPLNLLADQPGVDPDLGASVLADIFEVLVGEGLGGRMRPALVATIPAVKEATRDATLLDVLRVFEDERFRERLAARVHSPESRRYLQEVLPSEPRSTTSAITARLRHLLGVRRIRGLLSGSSECIRGADLLGTRLSIVSAGASPTGHGGQVGKLLGAFLLNLLTSAVFSRTERTPLVIWVDEFQTLTSATSEMDLEAALQRARAFGTSFGLITQGLGQLRSSTLVESILTNVSTWCALAPRDELRHLDRVLPPPTGRVLDPERPGRLLSSDAERRVRLAALGRLGGRAGIWAELSRGRSSVIERTANVPIDELDRLAEAAPAELHDAFARGRFGVPIADLIAGAERDEPAVDRSVAEPTPVRAPARRRGRMPLRLPS